MIVIDKPQACTRCLICEMACSFHHVGEFSRRHASLRVNTSFFEQDGAPRITICREKGGFGPVCDLCGGEDSPLCVRFCPERVLTRGSAPA